MSLSKLPKFGCAPVDHPVPIPTSLQMLEHSNSKKVPGTDDPRPDRSPDEEMVEGATLSSDDEVLDSVPPERFVWGSLVVLFINVNSILVQNRLQRIKQLAKLYRADVILLGDTRIITAQEADRVDRALGARCAVHTLSRHKKFGGTSVVALSDSVSFKSAILSEAEGTSAGGPDGRITLVDAQFGDHDITLVSVYAPTGPKLTPFLKGTLTSVMEELRDTGQQWILGGDLNSVLELEGDATTREGAPATPSEQQVKESAALREALGFDSGECVDPWYALKPGEVGHTYEPGRPDAARRRIDRLVICPSLIRECACKPKGSLKFQITLG